MTGTAVRNVVLGALTVLVAVGASAQPVPGAIPVPGGEDGVGFDDLRFSPPLGRVIVPAGGTGSLMLIEPSGWRVTRIDGFSGRSAFTGGHDDGVTSADEGRGFLFAVDRTAQRLAVVDPKDGRIVSSAKLAGSPDYVRYVEITGEVWVTQPDKERIEIFRLEGNPPRPVHDAFLDVPGGPESLVVDSHGRAYTNLWKGQTVAINTKNRGVGTAWPNGCEGSRGIALDEQRGFVFVGCSEGWGVALDAKTGKVLGRVETGKGVDLVDYSPRLGHLYVAAGKSGTLAIAEVSPTGRLTLLAEVPTAAGAHCVAADAGGHAYVCDPKAGRILVISDAFAAGAR